MNSPSYDTAVLLSESAINLGDMGVDLFVAKMPDSPDNCITIYDTGGFDHDSGIDYENPTIMIKIRNQSYLTGYALADSIKNEIDGLYNETINSTRYALFALMGDINHVGQDDNNRQILTLNFAIQRTPTA